MREDVDKLEENTDSSTSHKLNDPHLPARYSFFILSQYLKADGMSTPSYLLYCIPIISIREAISAYRHPPNLQVPS